jgi:hypothetical protein
MARVMGRLERIPKRGFNPHFKYEFVTDSDVLDAVRTAMAAEGMCLFVSMDGLQQDDKRTVANFKFTFADGESGQAMTVNWIGEAIDTQDKGIAKAATSALKYCLLKTFLMSTGDDPDSDSDGPVPPRAPRRAPTTKPPAPAAAGPTGETPPKPSETTRATTHWTQDQTARKKFWMWAANKSLTDEDVYAALGVESIERYEGSKADAVAAIESYIAGKIESSGEPETPAEIKARLQSVADASRWSGKPTDAQRGLLIGQLNDILGSDEACKLFLAWLFDYPTKEFSRTMLTGPQVVAVLDELAPEKLEDKTYISTNEKAVEAFRLMHRQAQLDSGQMDMFAEDA